MTTKLIKNELEKAKITLDCLRDLPEWFGIESALQDYVEKSKKEVFIASIENDEPAGFLYLTKNSTHTMEVYCMGIKKAYHRQGIGQALINHAVTIAKENKCQLLQVKTVGPSSDDVSYGKTRRFYEQMGFLSVEEIPDLWDPQNPCLIMVKIL